MNTYESYLKKLNKKQLTNIARIHHMPRYSTYKKEELAQKLEQFLRQTGIFHTFFAYLSPEEMDLFEKKAPSHNPFLCRRMLEGGYCFEITPGTYGFPEDFELLDQTDSLESSESQTQTESLESSELQTDSHSLESSGLLDYSFLLDCLEVAGALYGAASFTILKNMYEKASGKDITTDEIAAFVMDLPDHLQHFAIVDDLCIHQSLLPGKLYEKIRQCQGAQAFYYPGAAAIKHLARYGYLPDSHVDKMLHYMTKDLSMPLIQAQEEVSLIQAVLRQGGTIEDVLNTLHKRHEQNYGDDTVYLSLLNELLAHTRLLLCRGYTAPEKQKQILHPTKIYPNSPCPCGSGKKYKKCCYRHR